MAGAADLGAEEMLMFLFLVAALVAVVGAVTLVLVGGGDGSLPEAEPDRGGTQLPAHRPVHRGDIDAVRFPLVLRGYRMAEVDETLDRLAAELAERDARLAELEGVLAGAPAGAYGGARPGEGSSTDRPDAYGSYGSYGSYDEGPVAPAADSLDRESGWAEVERTGTGEEHGTDAHLTDARRRDAHRTDAHRTDEPGADGRGTDEPAAPQPFADRPLEEDPFRPPADDSVWDGRKGGGA